MTIQRAEMFNLILIIFAGVVTILGLIIVALHKKGILKPVHYQTTDGINRVGGGKITIGGTLFGVLLLYDRSVMAALIYVVVVMLLYLLIQCAFGKQSLEKSINAIKKKGFQIELPEVNTYPNSPGFVYPTDDVMVQTILKYAETNHETVEIVCAQKPIVFRLNDKDYYDARLMRGRSRMNQGYYVYCTQIVEE